MDPIRIATRRSQLALRQAESVAARLEQAHPGLRVELVPMSTQGDRILDAPLAKIGGKGLFTKELELAMRERRADLAVHSCKDLPFDLPDDMSLAAVLERVDPRDAFVSSTHASLGALPDGARVGTSSLRRECQLRALRPDLMLLPLRGNVNTRLAKLDEGEYDAIVLATAGLERLGLGSRIRSHLNLEESLPAIAQGTLAIECRRDDARIAGLVAALHHPPTWSRTLAERAFTARLQGGCQVPIAGYAELDGTELWLRGLVGAPDGRRMVRGERRGNAREAREIGDALAVELLARGADAILRELGVGV